MVCFVLYDIHSVKKSGFILFFFCFFFIIIFISSAGMMCKKILSACNHVMGVWTEGELWECKYRRGSRDGDHILFPHQRLFFFSHLCECKPEREFFHQQNVTVLFFLPYLKL